MFLLSRRSILLLSLTGLLVINLLLGTIFSGVVRAQAGEATWVDMATLDYRDKFYKDTNAKDARWFFEEQGADDGCADEIKGFTNPGYDTAKGPFVTQQVEVHKQKPIPGGCSPDGVDKITLAAEPAGYRVSFRWLDDSNIETADGTRKFSLQGDVFISITDGSVCKDYITVGTNKRSLQLTVRSNTGVGDNATQSLRNKYGSSGTSGYSFYNNIESAGDTVINGDSCHESNPVEAFADDKNSGTAGIPLNPADGESGAPTCEAGFDFSMSWIVCAFLGFVDSGLNTLQEQVTDLLVVGNDDYNNDQLKEAWSYFRNIASFLLIIIGLVMIIGQAVGKD